MYGNISQKHIPETKDFFMQQALARFARHLKLLYTLLFLVRTLWLYCHERKRKLCYEICSSIKLKFRIRPKSK